MTSQGYIHKPLDKSELRWLCDPDRFEFSSTEEIEPLDEIVGQDSAIEALRYGLETNAPGQNIFVRGLTGTGRSTTIRRLLESIRPPCPPAADRCYVYNFAQPDRPRLITVPRGEGERLARRLEALIQFVKDDLTRALSSDLVKSRMGELEKSTAAEIESLTAPFETELRSAGLSLLTTQMGPLTRQMIVPVVDGEPVPLEHLEALRRQGRFSDAALDATRAQIATHAERLQKIGESVQEIQIRHQRAIGELMEGEVTALLAQSMAGIRTEFPSPEVGAFLDGIIDDIASKRIQHLDQAERFTQLYRVNVVLSHDNDDCPIVIDNSPSLPGLVGSVDWSMGPDGAPEAPQLMVRGGTLLRADGGYLIVEARDVLTEPGAWKALIRTLRAGRIELTPPDLPVPWRMPMLRPDPIPVKVKVILLGDPGVYPMLEALDPDFANLFKVLADFDDVIPRDDSGLRCYANIVARIAREEELPAFDRSSLAELSEHGARIAARRGKLTARFGRLADLVREAAFVARRDERATVVREDVQAAIRRTKARADLPSRRFRDFVRDGTLQIATRGAEVGQINGLAVMNAGQLAYGFPTRITATIGPGSRGAINIEREAELSGAIHTKGFYILGGLLRHLLRTQHPLAFDASVAFEQSYAGIDGDSASGAEICCLLSALTELPLRADLAMTGAIDQMGHILPIGAVNEKIEGFYDACTATELTGSQGVVIPASNAGDLMLRHDVLEAAAVGRFEIHAIETIHEAIGLFTGVEPGQQAEDGQYRPDTVLGRAVERAAAFWQMGSAVPASVSDLPVQS
jgi:ATP-dependent Lon protease